MKPFALDTVLNYRQRLEDIAKNNLAQARLSQNEIELLLAEQHESYHAQVATIERVQQQGVNILELISLEEHLEFIKNSIKELEKDLKKKREHVVRVRNDLMKKARDRQVMEKLKERQNAEWRQFLNKKEAAMLDEIAIIHHNR